MKTGSGVRMATGNGENSYAANSRLQEKAILETRPMLRKAIEEVYKSLSDRRSTMVVADLGCSSGPNTLRVVSEVIGAVQFYTRKSEEQRRAVEVQFFLNDLPGNDFNLVFRSLEQLEDLGGKETQPYYVAGLPGSYYTKLFPSRSVHFFHSSYSLMWRSKFELFLTLRSRELVNGGRMLLTFLGRNSEEMMMHGDVSTLFELVAKSLQSLVLKGRVEKEKLDSFNLPYYAPSVKEVKALINESKLFDIEHVRLFQSNWDPQDDLDSDVVLDCASSGANVAKCIRAVLEPLIVDHFGVDIIEELFMVYASVVAKHLEKAKAKYPIIVASLKKARH
uniref:Benzoate carboxyl methyltransferase n=1 Tax=Aegilops tauschii subsp. strangulata TaxID=200361 RepID=A0A453RFA4_AEGTS